VISTNELKNGYVIDLDGELSTVVEFQHVKPGKGGAFVRTKLKNLATGSVVDLTCEVSRETSAEELNEAYRTAAAGPVIRRRIAST